MSIPSIQPTQSKLYDEYSSYVRFTSEGVTQVVDNLSRQDPNRNQYSYRQYNRQGRLSAIMQEVAGNNLYHDSFMIDVESFSKTDVILKRLSTLYGVTNRPSFFPADGKPTRPKEPSRVPRALNQIGLFDLFHYKSLFITQDYSIDGKYELLLNIEGRFELIAVDDKIPIYADNLQPIWGLTYQNPWQLILLKAYAKVIGGYKKLQQTKPFDFVEKVSNPTWKYFNLGLQAQEFLKFYSQNQRYRRGKIILKTKNNPSVEQAGLLPNSASYELISLRSLESQAKNSKDQYLLTVRSTSKTRWTGPYSFLDNSFQQYYQSLARENRVELNLDRDFLIGHQDTINLFSSAYITSNRNGKYFTGYKLLEIAANQKKAQHLQFYFPQDGFFDFSIKQFAQNITKSNQKSRVKISSVQEEGQRYLKTSYILVKDKDYIDTNDQQYLKKKEQNLNASHMYNGLEYAQTRYSIAQIDHTKGYNRGDAFFLSLKKGKYILRFKSQNIPKQARYAISWVTSSQIKVQLSTISQEDKKTLLHQAMVSKMHRVGHFYLAKDKKPMFSIADTFDQLGYGFVAAKNTKDCQVEIKIRVDPNKLRQEGYRLKGRNKDAEQPFEIVIGKGQYNSIVLKKIKDADRYVPLREAKGFTVLKKNKLGVSGITTNQLKEAGTKVNPLPTIAEERPAEKKEELSPEPRVQEQGNQPQPNSRQNLGNNPDLE